MTKKQWINVIREIKKTWSRYLSIMMITALGVAFYAGVRSAEPDMKLTAEKFYDETNFMDALVVSNWGFDEEDIKALGEIENIEKAEGAYKAEAFFRTAEKDYQMLVYSITDDINKVHVIEGRTPEKEGECFLDSFFCEQNGIKVNDKINLVEDSEINYEIKDILLGSGKIRNVEYTVVGYGTYPWFLSWDRGEIGIGNGDADGFVFIPKEEFTSDVYSYAFVKATNEDALQNMTEEYDEYVECINIMYESMERREDRKIEKYADQYAMIEELEAEYDEAQAALSEREEEYNERQNMYVEQVNSYDALYRVYKTQYEAAEKEYALACEKNVSGFELNELRRASEKYKLLMEETYSQRNELMAVVDTSADLYSVIFDEKTRLAQDYFQIQNERARLNAAPLPEWTLYSRKQCVESYAEYELDAERIGKIGRVFPAVFYIVAALVCLTTMTRMVEEDRLEIGTLIALGSGKMFATSKYRIYAASATLLGGALGAVVGGKILPMVIIAAYKILYSHLPKTQIPLHAGLSIISVVIAVACTSIATLTASAKILASKPAVLMRPETPRPGKRILLEKMDFLWKRLSFSWKASCRNLFRFKKRFFMTVFGIGACMSLLMVGFGIKDSIADVVNNQYKNIWTYDASITINDVSFSISDIKNSSHITNSLNVAFSSVKVDEFGEERTIYCFVPESVDNLDSFLDLHSRRTGKKYELKNNGVIISEKLAKILEVEVGDSIDLFTSKDTMKSVKVAGICENYLYHYVYMTQDVYSYVYNANPSYNTIYLKFDDMTAEEKDAFASEMVKNPKVGSVSFISDLQDKVDNMMGSLNLVVIVLIVSAALLVFIVLYNLNNINIIERRKELATLKVLGYFDGELAKYVYRENVWLTLIGIFAGAFLGYGMHKYVIATCEIDMVMFGRNVAGPSYLYCIALTLIFAAFVNLVMLFKLKKVDMVESLKSME